MQSDAKNSDWLPEKTNNDDGEERKVGVELEFSGVEPEAILDCIVKCFQGSVENISLLNYQVVGTDVGDFVVELDAQVLQSMVRKHDENESTDSIENIAETFLKTAAEQLVPWEVVTPPIKLSELHNLNSLFDCLRENGALGTRHAPHYAFGLHLNPEVGNFESETLTRYLQAYLCLYDWIYAQEKVDLTRKLTNHIDHFNKEYILKVVDENYQPDMDTLIEDYIEHNPTRNRSLDLLPLFAYNDEKWIEPLADRELIKARPTFHYRLPNCDIDNPNWNLKFAWGLWLKVEWLANKPKVLSLFIDEFREDYQRFGRLIDNKWVERCEELMTENLKMANTK